MRLDKKGIDFIKEREGYKETAYKDQAGVWTIGYGTTYIGGRKVKSDDICDKTLAELWLVDNLTKTILFMNDVLGRKIKVNQNQFNALISLTYNIGFDAFGGSTLLKVIKGNRTVFGDLFFRWNKITIKGKKIINQGLLNRRKLEYEMFIRDED